MILPSLSSICSLCGLSKFNPVLWTRVVFSIFRTIESLAISRPIQIVYYSWGSLRVCLSLFSLLDEIICLFVWENLKEQVILNTYLGMWYLVLFCLPLSSYPSPFFYWYVHVIQQFFQHALNYETLVFKALPLVLGFTPLIGNLL